MNLELSGKRVLVTGGTRGIGLGIVEAFLAEGASVAVAARGEEGLKPLGERGILAIPADMTDETQVEAALATAEAALGPLDIVVGNVGSGRSVTGWNVDAAEWQRVFSLNLAGAAALLRAAAARFVPRRAGAMVFVSSIAGLEALGAPAPYAAAKAGLQALVKSQARLLGPDGVRVNAVAPGNILFEGSTWQRRIAEQPAEVARMLQTDVPLQRLGTPSEIADAVLFLASPRAAFVTGATLVVDGGQTRAI